MLQDPNCRRCTHIQPRAVEGSDLRRCEAPHLDKLMHRASALRGPFLHQRVGPLLGLKESNPFRVLDVRFRSQWTSASARRLVPHALQLFNEADCS